MKFLTLTLKTIFIIFILAASNCNDDNLSILFEDNDLKSIQIVQRDYSIPKGLEQNFSVIGTYMNGKTRDLSDSAMWNSSDTLIATIGDRNSSEIVAKGKNIGTTTISVSIGRFSDSTDLNVTPPEIVSIAVTPFNDSIAKGLSLQYTAIGTYTDTSTVDITNSVAWTSSDNGVAIVNNSRGSKGLAETKDMGTTTITAKFGLISNSTELTVASPELVSIAINPENTDIIYAATMGIPFERNNKKGLYKTTDGGDTWEQVLFISDEAGVIDVVMNPENPNTLFACGWDRVRNNSLSIVNGQGAKVYRTYDAGENWTMLEGGLPQEDMSRLGLAISKKDTSNVFFFISKH